VSASPEVAASAPGAGEILTSAIKRKLSSKAGLQVKASGDERPAPGADTFQVVIIRYRGRI
jgi:hypothetical protein